jgi:hypothetical protein
VPAASVNFTCGSQQYTLEEFQKIGTKVHPLAFDCILILCSNAGFDVLSTVQPPLSDDQIVALGHSILNF